MNDKLRSIENLFKRNVQWLTDEKPNNIAISSRIRLARNLKDHIFPSRANVEDRRKVLGVIGQAVFTVVGMEDLTIATEMVHLDELDRQILLERHLISHEHINSLEGSGLFVNKNETVSIMINEEDHIRLQGMLPGMQLDKIYKKINMIDTNLSNIVNFAFRPTLGYLTSCPTNLGTGMRVSVMLHLPALVYADLIKKVINAVTKVGIAVRGLFGEGSESLGNLFQFSNQSTLGETEQQIINRLSNVVCKVIIHEQNARKTLLELKKDFIYDKVGRAFGVMKHAYLLRTKESLSNLSALRFGVDMNMFSGINVSKLNELLVLAQPGHLQKFAGKKLEREERDVYRAKLVREKLII